MEGSQDWVEFYKDRADEWRWRRQAPNGEIVADSGEGYIYIGDALQAAMRVNGQEVEYRKPEEFRSKESGDVA